MPETQMETNTEPRIGRSVSLDDAAALLGVSRRTIYNRIRDGRLQTIRTPGGSQRVLSARCRTPRPVGVAAAVAHRPAPTTAATTRQN